jgi:hypothetical protein
MKKTTLLTMIGFALIVFASCSRQISVTDAANGKAKCGRYLK